MKEKLTEKQLGMIAELMSRLAGILLRASIAIDPEAVKFVAPKNTSRGRRSPKKGKARK